MKNKLIRNGFVLAGLMNVGGVLVFSRAFSNSAINNADPVVMSNFGLLMITIWGMAYLSATTIDSGVKWVAGVFALEKLVYVVVWTRWMLENSLSSIYSIDLFAGIFYSIYGVNDFIFLLFFTWVFLFKDQEKQS